MQPTAWLMLDTVWCVECYSGLDQHTRDILRPRTKFITRWEELPSKHCTMCRGNLLNTPVDRKVFPLYHLSRDTNSDDYRFN